MRRPVIPLVVALSLAAGVASAAGEKGERNSSATRTDPSSAARSEVSQAQRKLPRRQVGKASIYHRKFANRKMANGERMDPQSDNAASKTLPLGTRAQVTNLETGKTAMVTIEDRGPYVQGRIVDLSPATAAEIGLTHKQGVAPVEVKPVEVPPPRSNG
jgi:rare lipoprotein A